MSEDIQVVVSPPVNAAKQPSVPWYGQSVKEWSPRRKVLSGLGLLSLLAVPIIVVPAVIVSQQKSSQQPAASEPSGAQTSRSSSGAGQEALTGGDIAPGFSSGTRLGSATGIRVPTAVDLSGAVGTNGESPDRSAGRTKRAVDLSVPSEPVSRFISVRGGQFDKDCRPHYPTGFNAYELTILAANGEADVDQVFSQAAALGMTSARTWAHSFKTRRPWLTPERTFNEDELVNLDRVLASAAKHGISLIISFIDNWMYYNNVDQFIDWSSTAPARTQPRPTDAYGNDLDPEEWSKDQKRYEAERHTLFFTDEGSKQLYKDHVAVITNRTNTINRRKYIEDETILGWNLINEPRCETWVKEDCVAVLAAWYTEMAEYVREQDPNHLVSSGSEGFFGDSDPSLQSKNPGVWALQTGQDFTLDNKHMDFAVAHAWPDNWMIPNERQSQFLADWLNSHLDAAKRINKPLLFEEFGKALDNIGNSEDIAKLRDPVFSSTYRTIESAIANNQPLLGSMFWKWSTPVFGKGPYDVEVTDTTMDIIRTHARRVMDLQNSVPPRPGCVYPARNGQLLGAWFGASDYKTGKQGCYNNPEAALAWHELYASGRADINGLIPINTGFNSSALYYARALARGEVRVYGTQAACCAPGLGAFPNGCKA